MKLIQVAIHADDLDRAQRFWSELLDAQPSGRFDPPGLLFYDLDGTRLLLERGAPTATVYLRVHDIAAALETLPAEASVISEPHVIFTHENDSLGPAGHQEWQAFVTDSEGNTVGLVQQRPV